VRNLVSRKFASLPGRRCGPGIVRVAAIPAGLTLYLRRSRGYMMTVPTSQERAEGRNRSEADSLSGASLQTQPVRGGSTHIATTKALPAC
jgi:hypothetical protein